KGIQEFGVTNQGVRGAAFGQSTVYLLFNKSSGALLKIGSTGQPNTIARLMRYVGKARAKGINVVGYAFDVSGNIRKQMENGLRSVLGKIYEMPWDNTGGRLGGW